MSDSAESLKARGSALFASGDTDGALTSFERALEACDDSTTVDLRVALLLNVSLLRLKRGDCDEALSRAREAISLAPSNAKAHYRSACALLQSGDLEGARSEAEFAAKLAPKSSDIKRLCESVAAARREKHVQNARIEAQRSVNAHRTSTDLLSQIEDIVKKDDQTECSTPEDEEVMEWRKDVCETCMDIVREYREMEELLVQSIRAGRAVDVMEVDAELEDWRRALPQMEPLEKLKLTDELAEMRRSVETTANSAELGDMPKATRGICDKLTALLNEIIEDATAHGPRGSDIKNIAEQARKDLAAFAHNMDFAGCLQRVDDLIFETIGAKPVDGLDAEK